MSVRINSITGIPVLTLTVEHKDVNEVLRRFVSEDGTRAGAGEKVIGVSRTASTAIGDDLPVDVAGVTIVEAGAAIAADDLVKSDADGRAVTRPDDPVVREVVDGENANTNIAVSDIAVGDELLDVLALDAAAVNGPTIHANGQIRATNSTNNKKLLVIWRPKSARAGRALAAAAAAGNHVPVLIGLGN